MNKLLMKWIYLFSIPISDHGSFDMTSSGITLDINLIIGTFEIKKKKGHISKNTQNYHILCNGMYISIKIDSV